MNDIDELLSWDSQSARADILQLSRTYEVHLGGSRSMAARELVYGENPVNINDDTDYDFYVTHTDELLDTLMKWGWVYTGTNAQYYDSEALHILEKENHQIVLRKDAVFYHRVFTQIPVWFYHDYLWKRNPYVDRNKIQDIIEVLFEMARHD